MQIHFIKAGSGDSILIRHESQNILVDGGNDFTYLNRHLRRIKDEGEKLNLLVITHHDDDHINGLLQLLNKVVNKEFGEDFIEKIIFNSPRSILGTLPKKELSYKQANIAESLIAKLEAIQEGANEDTPDVIIGDMSLEFLSPTVQDLKEYAKRAPTKYLTGDQKCDWKSSMAELEKFIQDDSLDNVLPNRTSIVILVKEGDRRILLPGDCPPSRLSVILQKLVDANNGHKVKLNYLKLPHHGSYRSLSKNVLEKIECNKFVISTDASKYFLPNKRAILKILKYMPQSLEAKEFLFNYSEAKEALKITKAEEKKYNIKLTPNNNADGFSI